MVDLEDNDPEREAIESVYSKEPVMKDLMAQF